MTIPYNVLVVSALGLDDVRAPEVLGPFLPEEGVNPVLQQVAPSVRVEVPDWRDPVGGRKGSMVDLAFSRMVDLRPRGIAGRIPGLAPLLGLMDGVRKVRAGRAARRSLVSLVEDATGREVRPGAGKAQAREGASLKVSKDAVLEGLMELVDTGERPLKGDWPGPPSGRTLSDLLDEAGTHLLGDSGLPGEEWLEMVEAAAQSALDQVLSAVFDDETFRRLETSWQGLAFLMGRIPRSTDIRVYCLCSSGEAALEVLEGVSRELWSGRDAGVPSVIIWDQYFDSGPGSLALLQRLAELAHAFMVPVVAACDLSFFHVRTWEGFVRLPYLPNRLSQPGFGTWQTLVRGESARWVALGFNPVLLRAPYGKDYVRDRFPFFQPSRQALWGTPAWALGAIVARGYASSGWPHLSAGPGGLVLEDMPIARGPHGVMPVRYPLPEGRAMELSDAGIIALVSPRAEDKVWAFSDVVLHGAVGRSDPGVRAQCTLTHQLFLARFLRLLDAATRLLPSDLGDRETAFLLEETVSAWTGQEGIEVRLRGEAGARVATITLGSVPHVPGAPGLRLEIRLPG